METMKGARSSDIGPDLFRKLIQEYFRTCVDLGCGDGKYCYEMARTDPDTFYIGIDADRNGLVEYSRRIVKKPSRGGLKNVLYLISNVESLPEELNGIADEVTVILPWGSLLQGMVGSDPLYLSNIRRISKDGSLLKIYLNYDVKYEPVEMERKGLPELTEGYVEDHMVPAYASAGIRIAGYRFMENEEARSIPSTWTRKLGFGRARSTLLIEGVIEGGSP
ncbi:MAG: methyltransferase domain-containing protein [Candidatus Thermoplasmatota archaeon]|nr:methyltransferase domain-containing protein [Candidatus Thermoplasmatota archaeon]